MLLPFISFGKDGNHFLAIITFLTVPERQCFEQENNKHELNRLFSLLFLSSVFYYKKEGVD